MGLNVIKRDGSLEAFDVDKIAKSIFNAAVEAGGDDFDLAEELADKVEEVISSDINGQDLSADDIQRITEKVLIEEGHALTSKAYILKAADRGRMRSMDTALMKSFEEITFKSPDESEVKRENGNIDSNTAMGTMLKYGSEAAKSFNLLYLMSKDVSDAHKNGDIHIHDLDFAALTETCIDKNTMLTVKINGVTTVVTVEQLAKYVQLSSVDEWKKVENIKILSDGKYVELKSIVKHRADNKHMMYITTPTGELHVTDEHIVSIIDNGKVVDRKVSDINVGDILSIPTIDIDRYSLDAIDIITLYTGENLVISNTDEIIRNIKNSGNWKEFCSIFPYDDKRASLIRNNKAKMTIPEYKSIEHLCSMRHSDLQIHYKRSRGNETINAVVPLTFELGNVIGLMYTEGSITEHVDPRQKSMVKKACFCNYDTDLIEQFNRYYSTIFNNAKITDRKHNGRHTGSILSGYLQYELFHGIFGIKNSTEDIRLAQWMFGANREFISGLLAGIIDGDGTVQRDGYRVMIGSVSKGFLQDIQKLLLLRGITSTIKQDAISGAIAKFTNDMGDEVCSVRQYSCYKLEITGNLYNKIAWVNSNKVNAIDLKSSNKFPYKQVTITNIHEVEYSDFVYDLETENHHFTADGFNVHNCCQIPLDKLFKDGFNTGHGFLREPGNIRTAGALAAIAIQSNQNDQHGGQSVPMFDFYLAPYVALTYAKQIASIAKFKLDLGSKKYEDLKNMLVEYQKEHKLIMNDRCKEEIEEMLETFFKKNHVKCSDKRIRKIMDDAYIETYEETYQAMEAFIHNLNTMHCLPASEKIWVLDVNTNTFKSITMEELNNTFKPNKYKVVSLNKKTGKAEFKFITHCNKLDNNRKLIKITDNQGRTVRVTDNHRIMTMNGTDITEDIPKDCDCTISPRGIRLPVTKSDLCVSDYDKPRKDNPFKNDHVIIDENFAEFIGYYMADGCILGETSTCCISACGKVTFREMKDLLNRTFGCTFKTSYTYFEHSKDGTTEKDIRIQLGMPLARMIKDKFGRVCHEKKIPTELMFAPKEVRKAFLKAYFKLDGRKDKHYSEVSTVNKELQAQIAFMLSSIGVSAHYTTRQCTPGFDTNMDRSDMHFITLSGHDSMVAGIKDNDDTEFEIPKYNLKAAYEYCPELCDEITRHRESRNLRYSELSQLIDDYGVGELEHLENIFINDIVSKEEINSSDEYVYDISVEDNENFLTYECIFVHNSRAGAQVPFSSINYGTDTSTEGRMVMRALLESTDRGLGNGETPIFPIQIVKLKSGINYNKDDINYDIFKLACSVSAKRLYPNFANLDAPYNLELYKEGHPETEVAYMGCRTRVGTNVYDPSREVIPGRGNLSFTSINLPRLGILANGDIDHFFKLLDSRLELVHKQLLERFELQCQKHPINYPFLMGQGVWLGSDKIGPNDDIRNVLKHGTLTVGFIGLAECLTALVGKHHGESEEAQKLGLKIIGHMREYTDAWSKDETMNYSVIGTPAEGLSGRFIRIDKERFGIIPGVTGKDYYTNSSHVPVSYPISATKKIEIEAPYHALENGGHILYIEMDGDPTKNIKAFEKVVRYMHDKGAGYFAINHPVDRDPVCGYVGIIGDTCPRCGRHDGEAMTMEMWMKIKGYANVGNADTCGACGNPDEEADRLSNN
jgi:anaerobic ribonucleoside-triphosphate reductase